jgi:hypothetical protein
LVSGTNRVSSVTATTRLMKTTKIRVLGAGRYSAKKPATSGPSPRPPMLAAVETTAGRALFGPG